jgi:hypothetical protein
MFKAFVVVFSFALSAQAASVEVLNAGYYSKTETIELLVSCNGHVNLKVNSCTEMVPHQKCVATVTGSACTDNSQHWIIIPREELNYETSLGIENLGSPKFEDAKLLIRGNKFEAEISLGRT